jgi:cell division protein FtsB
MDDTEGMIALAVLHTEGVAMRRENRALAERVAALEAVAEAARSALRDVAVEQEYGYNIISSDALDDLKDALKALKGAGVGR